MTQILETVGVPFPACQVEVTTGSAGTTETVLVDTPNLDPEGYAMVEFLDIQVGTNVTSVEVAWKSGSTYPDDYHTLKFVAGNWQGTQMFQYPPADWLGEQIVVRLVASDVSDGTRILMDGEVIR